MSSGIESQVLSDKAEAMRGQGETVMFVSIDGKIAGLLGVADPIKETTAEAISLLHGDGMRIVMVTGDSRTTAEAVSKKLGLDEVMAEVLPDKKAVIVKQLQEQGKIVAMAGDGINDAPALAQAHVGIAMGTGTDVAMESAGVTLVKGRPPGNSPGQGPQPRHHAKHQGKPLFRPGLQRHWRAHSRRHSLPLFRDTAEPCLCGRGHELQFRFGCRQRAALKESAALSQIRFKGTI